MSQVNYNSQSINNAIARNLWFINKVAPLPNNKLDWTTKGVVLGLSEEFIRAGVPHSQQLKVWYPNVADNAGVSVDTVKSGVAKLAKVHGITKETKKVPCGPTKEKKNRTFIAFTPEFIVNPGLLLADAEDLNHGGKRLSIRCPHCDEYHPLRKASTFTCTGCGSVIEELSKAHTVENEAPQPEVRTDAEIRLLTQLDSLIKATDKYYDAAEIDDDAVEAMGGAEMALAASPSEIAKVMAVPYVVRKYGEDAEELLEAAWDVMDDMKKVIPFPQQQQDKPIGKKDSSESECPSLFDAM